MNADIINASSKCQTGPISIFYCMYNTFW